MNRWLWRIHSWMGLLSGIGLLLIGVTGSLLVFHDEVEMTVTPGLFRVKTASQERLPMDILFAGVLKAMPGHEISSWTFAARPNAVDRAYVVKHGDFARNLVTVDPHTGAVLGGPVAGPRTFMGRVMELHYTFFAGATGMLLAGIFAVLLCLLGLSGIWIYKDFWSNFLRFRWRASRQILFSDLHKTVGITTIFFQIILGFTGAYWNLPMAMRQYRFANAHPAQLVQQNWSPAISLDVLLDRSRQALPGFRPVYMGFPIAPGGDIQIGGHADHPFRSDYCDSVTFDAQSGTVKLSVGYSEFPAPGPNHRHLPPAPLRNLRRAFHQDSLVPRRPDAWAPGHHWLSSLDSAAIWEENQNRRLKASRQIEVAPGL